MHAAEQLEPALIGAVKGYGTASNCWSWSSEARRGHDLGSGLDMGTGVTATGPFGSEGPFPTLPNPA